MEVEIKKKEKMNYQNEVFEILNLSHKCYDKIRTSNNIYELDLNFFHSLKSRSSIINAFLMDKNLNINEIKNFSFYIDLNNKDETINTISNYLNAVVGIDNLNSNGIRAKRISIKELLCNSNWSDQNLNNLEMKINNFNGIIDDESEKFFEVYSKDIIFGSFDSFKIYENIKKDIFDYIYNDIDKYKDILKKNYKKTYDEKKVKKSEYFLNYYIEMNILNDLEITLQYLKKCEKYNEYIDILKDSYSSYNRYNELELIHDEYIFNTSHKITKLSLDFSLSLENVVEQVKSAYKFFNDSSFKSDYALLFDEKDSSPNFPFKGFTIGNKSTASDFFNNNKFKSIHKFEVKKFKVKVEMYILYLFIFDCYFFCLDSDTIDKYLKKEFDNLYNGKIFTNKEQYFNKIFNIIKEINLN